MKKLKMLLVGLTLLNVGVVHAVEVCKVTDPSSTPLNVRNAPNGTIIGTLKNFTQVKLYERSDNGLWVYVSWNKQPLNKRKADRFNDGLRNEGWVYREFVSCYNKK